MHVASHFRAVDLFDRLALQLGADQSTAAAR